MADPSGRLMVSPSSRRAWVEIALVDKAVPIEYNVALLAEGVGRNLGGLGDGALAVGRPPRGGRG